jgi:hypothetical protein
MGLFVNLWTYGESDPDLVHAMDAFYCEKRVEMSASAHSFRSSAEAGSFAYR